MEDQQENINVNQHIIDYLDYYLDSQGVYKSNYAVLLRGDWGGKLILLINLSKKRKRIVRGVFVSYQNRIKINL